MQHPIFYVSLWLALQYMITLLFSVLELFKNPDRVIINLQIGLRMI